MISIAEFKHNLDCKLNQLIASGVPIEIDMHGHVIKITVSDIPSKLDRLHSRPNVMRCDPQDIVHNDWSVGWNGDLP